MEQNEKRLQGIIDKFFENYTSFIKPELSEELANEVNDWHVVSLPGQVAIFRKSGFINLNEGYEGEPPVVIIERKPECRNKTYG